MLCLKNINSSDIIKAVRLVSLTCKSTRDCYECQMEDLCRELHFSSNPEDWDLSNLHEVI